MRCKICIVATAFFGLTLSIAAVGVQSREYRCFLEEVGTITYASYGMRILFANSI